MSNRSLIFFVCLVSFCWSAVAQTNGVAAAPALPDAAGGFVVGLAQKYPVLATLIGVLGFLRLIMKPLFSLLHSVVLATPTTKDEALLEKVESSPVLRTILWLLDYVASVKLIHPDTRKE